MLNESLKAYEILKKNKINITVINFSTLNYFNLKWMKKVLNMSKNIFVIDDHNISGGLGDLMNSFSGKQMAILIFTK